MSEPKVYIIILNWNGWQDTLECLASVVKLNYPNYQVVVVDNGSTDDSVRQIKEWVAVQGAKHIVLIETGQNLGYAGGNNAGLRYALERGGLDYAWVLNNDTTVDPGALAALVAKMRRENDRVICGSVLLHYEEPLKIWALGGRYDRWFAQGWHIGGDKQYDPGQTAQYLKIARRIDYVVGASVFVARHFLTEIGLMSEDYFLFFEELDWAVRAKGRYRLALAPDSLVYHKGGSSVKKKEKEEGLRAGHFSPLFDRYITRNRLLFTKKFYPYCLPVLYLSVLGYILDRLRVGAWDSVRIIWGELGRHFSRDIFRFSRHNTRPAGQGR
jgi:GT2 family glycosyltransferase